MAAILIKTWAEENSATELLSHIACAVPGYANIDLFVDNIYYEEVAHEVQLSIDPSEGKHASHRVGDQTLFHGGQIAMLIDVATCALAFTMCDGSQIPVTRAIKDLDFVGTGIIGIGKITVSCHLSEDDGRDMTISAWCKQGDRPLAKAIVAISRMQMRTIKRGFRELTNQKA